MFLPSVSGTHFGVVLQFTAFPHPITIDNCNNVWLRVPILTVLITAPSRSKPHYVQYDNFITQITHNTPRRHTPPTHLVMFFNYTHTIRIGWAVYSSPHGRVNRIINMIDDRMIDKLLISFCLFQYRTSIVDGDTDWPADSSYTYVWCGCPRWPKCSGE